MTTSTNSTQKNTINNNDLEKHQSLSEFLKQHTEQNSTQQRSIPPLHLWHPKNCGKMDLVIKSNGEWWHEGTKMTRQSLVDLFATVLWKEEHQDGVKYFLKTPVEKIEITVEDAPLFINQINLIAEEPLIWIELTTTTKDTVRLDANHPIYFKETNGEQKPYIMVRHGLEALISRQVFYHLIKIGELSQDNDQTLLTLHSGQDTLILAMANQ